MEKVGGLAVPQDRLSSLQPPASRRGRGRGGAAFVKLQPEQNS